MRFALLVVFIDIPLVLGAIAQSAELQTKYGWLYDFINTPITLPLINFVIDLRAFALIISFVFVIVLCRSITLNFHALWEEWIKIMDIDNPYEEESV